MTEPGGVNVPAQTIAFHLTADERKQLRARAFPENRAVWFYFACTIAQAVRVPMILFPRHPHSPWQTAFELLLAGATLAAWGTVAVITRRRGRDIPAAGSLRVSDAGFTGTLDDVPADISWSDIESVQDIGEAIVLRRRRNEAIVIIPKTRIPGLSSLWSLLEDRLVSKRGLIRSRPPRRLIQNSAYPQAV